VTLEQQLRRLVPAADSLIRSLCHEKEGWEYEGGELVAKDPWGADRLLVFRRTDYVTCYVGFHGVQPLFYSASSDRRTPARENESVAKRQGPRLQ
jgi:hypothetical protein